jgi:hypothetical protein
MNDPTKHYGEDAIHREDMIGQDTMHEEDAFLRYDPDEALPQAEPSDLEAGRHDQEPPLEAEMSIDRIEDEQTGNSIQGLLAASRMINAGNRDQDDRTLLSQVSTLNVMSYEEQQS